MGERQFATVLKGPYRANEGLSCVKKYSCITVLEPVDTNGTLPELMSGDGQTGHYQRVTIK